MRPRRSASTIVVWAGLLAIGLATVARADDSFEAFATRLGLRGTLRTWQLDRLRHGSEAMKVEAARALAGDAELLSEALAPDVAERVTVLREVVAALPEGDAAAARLRLELARQQVAEAASGVDRLRGEPGDRDAAQRAVQALSRAREILAPVLAAGSTRRRSDPRTAMHEGGELLEAWVRTLSAWLARHAGGDARAAELDLARAIVQFARLVDADADAPRVANASADLLRTEFGAEAALGLANALELANRGDDALAWLDAIEAATPPARAARRVPAARLAFAIDRADAKAMQRALERMPVGSLSPALAIATTRVAAALAGDQAQALAARSLDAMDASTRASWIERVASQPGPLHDLAEAVRAAQATWPELSGRSMPRERAVQLARALQGSLQACGARAPAALRGEALRLQAWCERAAGDDRAATITFELAAGESAQVRPESLWMAAVCEPADSDAGRARRLDLLRRQRAVDPAGPFAGRVATWLSRLDAFPSDALAVAVLLEVPDSDPFLGDARAEAARRLLAGSVNGELARAAARRALQALEPVASNAQVARWRLAAALAAEDLDTAAQAARDLPEQDRVDPANAAGLARLQVLQGDLAAARASIEALPADRRAGAALTAVDALFAMQGAERRQAAIELAALAVAVSADRAETLAAARERLARAMLLAADDQAPVEREIARRVAEELGRIEAPTRVQSMAQAEALRRAGRVAEAVERLQRLSGGMAQGSAAWAEARWRLFEALRELDPRRASVMLQQHLALAPDGGPAPWGARFLQASKGRAP